MERGTGADLDDSQVVAHAEEAAKEDDDGEHNEGKVVVLVAIAIHKLCALLSKAQEAHDNITHAVEGFEACRPLQGEGCNGELGGHGDTRVVSMNG